MLHCLHQKREGEMDETKKKDNAVASSKATWEAPTIEEIDYAQTEAQYGIPGVAEFAIYTN
jgi:hypothetical protein